MKINATCSVRFNNKPGKKIIEMNSDKPPHTFWVKMKNNHTRSNNGIECARRRSILVMKFKMMNIFFTEENNSNYLVKIFLSKPYS